MKQDQATPELLQVDETMVRYARDGFFHCAHCRQVVTPSQQAVDAAENAPAGRLMKLKCPNCKKWEVSWRFPSPDRQKSRESVPVPTDKAARLFLAMKQAVV